MTFLQLILLGFMSPSNYKSWVLHHLVQGQQVGTIVFMLHTFPNTHVFRCCSSEDPTSAFFSQMKTFIPLAMFNGQLISVVWLKLSEVKIRWMIYESSLDRITFKFHKEVVTWTIPNWNLFSPLPSKETKKKAFFSRGNVSLKMFIYLTSRVNRFFDTLFTNLHLIFVLCWILIQFLNSIQVACIVIQYFHSNET
jgi:hypothetical protein